MSHEEVRNWGYQLNEWNTVWVRPGYQSIDYSDGDNIERSIAEIVDRAEDLGLFSAELKAACLDWASTYHLSGVRANILRPFESRLRNARVLEVGAGCGAITRYLGETAAHVVALEGTLRRAGIARSRTRDQANVQVICDRFGDFRADVKFDFVTLIGVLEYAPLFEDGPDTHTALLTRACELLKPDGQLIIAIENQLGLKYFAGAPEDHKGHVGYGIEDLYSGTEPETLGRAELQHKLRAAGFGHCEFSTPFPDYKFPTSIVTAAGWANEAFDAAAFACQTVRKDPQLPPQLAFALERAWPVVARNGLGIDLSNSFLIAASKRSDVASDSRLAYHYSTERRAEYCKETLFLPTPEGIRIRYRKVTHAIQAAEAELRLMLPESANYVSGQLLSTRFVQALVRDGWTLKQFGALLRTYAQWLIGLSDCTGQPELESSLPGDMFDAVPQNIMVGDDGRWMLIDKEWIYESGLSLGYLLFRTLLLTLQGLTRLGVPADTFEYTRRGFMIASLRAAGFDADENLIEGLARTEAHIQSIIDGRRPSDHLNWWADSPLIFDNVFAELTRMRSKLETTELTRLDLEQRLAQAQSEADMERRTLERRLGALEEERARLGTYIDNQHVRSVQLDQQLRAQARMLDQYQWFYTRLQAPRILLSQTFKAVLQRLRLDRVYTNLVSRSKVVSSGLFDIDYYLGRYDDVRLSGKDPISHYLLHGWREGRDPSRNFSTNWYLQDNFDVRLMGVNPLLHYIQHGRGEGRLTGPATSAPHFKSVVPYFLSPYAASIELPRASRVAVHLCLPQVDCIEVVSLWLNQIPSAYDLFISLPFGQSTDEVESVLRANLQKVDQLRIRRVTTGEPPVVNLCREFGADLIAYDLAAHLQVPDLENARALLNFEVALGRLMGGAQCITQIWRCLEDDGALVYAGMTEPEAVLKQLPRIDLSALLPCGIDDKAVEIDPTDYLAYPSFWFQPRRLNSWIHRLADPDSWTKAPNDVAEQSVLAFAQMSKGRSYKLLPQSQTIGDQTWYEDQRDYSSCISSDVKVLAYYLPQFHPTSENDEWHGIGFTEWHKVASCNPLFIGHYQQHIPHDDIGYYTLTTPNHLYTQAEMMRQSGVYGMIFYHYWFGGRMILEKPAKLLLSNPDIAMSYCFCWANENWTRRWDGNEQEILLGQNYSPDDARGFIEYLLPFFKDPRYIRVGVRPVLMIYRPSSVEHLDDYLEIWAKACQTAGLPPPYVVATLTRGANSPREYGMDAAAERVLHDWTNGAVPEIKQNLTPYWPINGRVLDYTSLADFYMQEKSREGFDYFRSLVPIWDNTPRYQSEAYIVHGFSTRKFQEWLEFLVADARNRLPEDRRFVMINAWNEWAEGAHLEPDAAIGYGYLNSIGRALSGIAFDDVSIANSPTLTSATAVLRLNSSVQVFFESDADAYSKFKVCLQRAAEIANLNVVMVQSESTKFILNIERPCLFDPHALILMRNSTSRYPGFAISANVINDPSFIDDGTPSSAALERTSMTLVPSGCKRGKKVCYSASTFVFADQNIDEKESEFPRVGTVMRFHERGDVDLLFNALNSLLVQSGCKVKPWIGMQDLQMERASELEMRIRAMPWADDCQPVIKHFNSQTPGGDLRAVMLNEGLKEQMRGYVGFLDYDDTLYPDAYRKLIARIQASGKMATFGRVYTADVEQYSGRVMARRPVYVTGLTYEDFYHSNHAPLHSFLLDTRLIDLRNIQYFNDMKYMEDYFLTLQIFTPTSADWEALTRPVFVGDYNHRIGADGHTLAVNENEKSELLGSELYRRCQERIDQLRAKIRRQGLGSIDVCN